MNPRDQDLLTAINDENSRTPEDRARVIRIRVHQARALAWERRARETPPARQRGRSR